MLKSLLNGHEVSLNGGANDILAQQILHLFTEVKRIQSEQSASSAQANIPCVSTGSVPLYTYALRLNVI